MTATTRPARILVIDDSITVCSLIRHTLIREGYTVTAFNDELEAFSALLTGALPVPDLVFLDIRLKQLDGYSIARMLHQKSEMTHTIIVMISGVGGRIERWRAARVGAKAFINKPFHSNEIINVVHTLLRDN